MVGFPHLDLYFLTLNFLITGKPRGSSCIAVEIKVHSKLHFFSYYLF